jgi:hypothetical protein
VKTRPGERPRGEIAMDHPTGYLMGHSSKPKGAL